MYDDSMDPQTMGGTYHAQCDLSSISDEKTADRHASTKGVRHYKVMRSSAKREINLSSCSCVLAATTLPSIVLLKL